MKVIGYARVSTNYQKFDSQLSKLKKYGCDVIYLEKESGTLSQRPVLEEVVYSLKRGDTFVIYRLDRLSRGTRYLLELMEQFDKRGINFVSLNDNIDTTSPMGRFFFTIMGAFAEMEASLIRERVRAGLQATQARGTKLGRPVDADKRDKVLYLIKNGWTVSAISNTLKISRTTIYRYLNSL